MPTATDFPTTGKVIEIKDGVAVFVPRGTTYSLHLKLTGDAPPLNTPIDAIIRATARKVWTVPSGGNFLVPIVGPPRIIQGRVKYADESQVVLHAGASVLVELPRNESAVDLPNGAIVMGAMVNATLLPGTSFEYVPAAAAQESIKSPR